MFDRRDITRVFRERLSMAMARAGLNRSTLAAQSGIDRSTLSQLLSPDLDRLPRADTIAMLATALHVSLDWLLGLSRDDKLGADIMHESLEITPTTGDPIETSVSRWHEEAAGYKIRYVPAALPDSFRTDATIDHLYSGFVAKSADRALAESRGRLEYVRNPDTDMEICMPRQTLESLAFAEGIWRGFAFEDRVEQLDRMIRLTDELYPGLRLFLFDGLTHYSVPFTVFGPLRASVYMGQMFFVFNTQEHIRVLTRHFDNLIRAAVIQASDATDYLKDLRRRTIEGRPT